MSLLLGFALCCAASTYQESFDSANAAHQKGAYAEAAAEYGRLAGSGGENADVYYNMGNTMARMGKPGAAIACYEKALQLAPAHEPARHNLEKMLENTKRNLAKPLPPDWQQALLFWHENLTLSAVSVLALSLWLAFWVVAALRVWRPLPWLRPVAAVCCLLAVVAVCSVWVKANPAPLAVATRSEVPVFFGKNQDEPPRFMLYEGDRAAPERIEGDWVLLSTAGGERGWARRSTLALVTGRGLELEMDGEGSESGKGS